jgi:hypothetical protein
LDFVTDAVLSQLSPEDGKWHPIAFMSECLSPVECNYKIHDKEMLAIVRALEEWRHFLEGAEHQFEIWTDHKNLEYFRKSKKLNRRQARWSLLLARFDFLMHHRPGSSMGKSDALSRQSDHGSGTNDNEDIVLLTPDLFAVRALEGSKEAEKEEVVAKAVKELQKTSTCSIQSAEWSRSQGLLYFHGKVYVPDFADLRHRIVSLCHDTKIA